MLAEIAIFHTLIDRFWWNKWCIPLIPMIPRSWIYVISFYPKICCKVGLMKMGDCKWDGDFYFKGRIFIKISSHHESMNELFLLRVYKAPHLQLRNGCFFSKGSIWNMKKHPFLNWRNNFCPVTFCPVWFFLTDRQTDRQKVKHMSPPCMSTGGLKNHLKQLSTSSRSIYKCYCKIIQHRVVPQGYPFWYPFSLS